MRNRTLIGSLALGCAMLVLILSPPVLAGGPPWISIETPNDPTNPSTRGAVLRVRAYSCGTPTSATVIGTADGNVVGEHRTIPLAEPAENRGSSSPRAPPASMPSTSSGLPRGHGC
jgi:hypothetical protein